MTDTESLIQRWRAAYAAANKTEAPNVYFERGWFYIGGYRRGAGWRKSKLQVAAANLEARASCKSPAPVLGSE